MGQIDLYRINLNRNQRSEIDTKRQNTAQELSQKRKTCNFEQKKK